VHEFIELEFIKLAKNIYLYDCLDCLIIAKVLLLAILKEYFISECPNCQNVGITFLQNDLTQVKYPDIQLNKKVTSVIDMIFFTLKNNLSMTGLIAFIIFNS
jgi:hypothetical protein